MVQKYGGADETTIPYFIADFKAMVKGRGNHPSIVQFETFNEADCWGMAVTTFHCKNNVVKKKKCKFA